jgi:hypothetical protein
MCNSFCDIVDYSWKLKLTHSHNSYVGSTKKYTLVHSHLRIRSCNPEGQESYNAGVYSGPIFMLYIPGSEDTICSVFCVTT